jgi:plastocyanin
MKKHIYTLFLLLATAYSAVATNHLVSVSNFSFTPAALTVTVGDTVTWVLVSGSHTTTSILTPAGAPTWDSPLNSGTQMFSYQVLVAGNYSYVCVPHQSMGMTGMITANSATGIQSISEPQLNFVVKPGQKLLLTIDLPRTSALQLSVHDLLGRTVNSNGMTNQPAGRQEYEVDLAGNPYGYYFVRLVAGDNVLTRRFLLQ